MVDVECNLENYQDMIERAAIWLNIMALAMCLLVILRKMKKPFLTFFGHVRHYFLQNQASHTEVVTIEMEMVQMDGVSNNHASNNVINHSIDIEEYIRLVI